jgi:hypothetical protein
MTTILLDPTAETASVVKPRIARLPSLDGKTIALLDIHKMRGDEFIDRLEELLNARDIATKRYSKTAFTHHVSMEVKQRIREECDAVIEALAD